MSFRVEWTDKATGNPRRPPADADDCKKLLQPLQPTPGAALVVMARAESGPWELISATITPPTSTGTKRDGLTKEFGSAAAKALREAKRPREDYQ